MVLSHIQYVQYSENIPKNKKKKIFKKKPFFFHFKKKLFTDIFNKTVLTEFQRSFRRSIIKLNPKSASCNLKHKQKKNN